MKLVLTSNEPAFARLSDQIVALATLQVSPSAKEKLVKTGVVEQLDMQVRRIWGYATVVSIGSSGRPNFGHTYFIKGSHHTC
jgi:hypothetical protein